jgi:hypothetical protein
MKNITKATIEIMILELPLPTAGELVLVLVVLV